ncbi:MAG: hypothetical protein M3430_11720 [Acidobacteriota bacterium]|nr:hypothetical protein [Acidobacteriota bacterium]
MSILRWCLINFLGRSIFALALIACATSTQGVARAAGSPPELFTYAELTALYDEEEVPPSLAAKLNRLLTTPFVDNSRANRTCTAVAHAATRRVFARRFLEHRARA